MRVQCATARSPALSLPISSPDPVLEALQKKGEGTYTGCKFTSPSKQQLMEGLAVAIQQRHIRYPDGGIAHELASFGYAYTRTGVQYAAPEGLHDDCVYALALAWRCYEQHRISAVACPVSLSTRRSPWDFDSSGHRTGSW